jgi:hypothetical protein
MRWIFLFFFLYAAILFIFSKHEDIFPLDQLQTKIANSHEASLIATMDNLWNRSGKISIVEEDFGSTEKKVHRQSNPKVRSGLINIP